MRPGCGSACRRAGSRGRRSGSLAGTLLAILAAADVVDTEEAREELVAAADAGDCGTGRFGVANPAATNRAKQLARLLEHRIGVVIAGGHLAPVARRWRTQLNENAKTWAMWDELPKLRPQLDRRLRGAAGPSAGDPGDRPPRHGEPPGDGAARGGHRGAGGQRDVDRGHRPGARSAARRGLRRGDPRRPGELPPGDGARGRPDPGRGDQPLQGPSRGGLNRADLVRLRDDDQARSVGRSGRFWGSRSAGAGCIVGPATATTGRRCRTGRRPREAPPGRRRNLDDAQLPDRQGREGESLRPRARSDSIDRLASRSAATTTPIT